MPTFGKRSLENLKNCHPNLKIIAHEAIKEYDFSVICGLRTKQDQEKAFNGGFSKVKYPNSRHNQSLLLGRKDISDAFDLCPYPIDWNDIGRFKALSVIIKRIAKEKNIQIEYGGDWAKFRDYPHYQLKI